MVSLNELIARKTEELSATELPHSGEREFFEEVLKNYNVNNIDSMDSISNIAYLICVLISHGIQMDFYELISYAEEIEDYVNKVEFDALEYNCYFKKLKEAYDSGLLKQIIDNEDLKLLNRQNKKLYNEIRKSAKKLFIVQTEDGEEYSHEIYNVFNDLFYALPEPERFECFLELNVVVEHIQKEVKSIVDESFEEMLNDDMLDELDRAALKRNRNVKVIEADKKRIINSHIKDFISMFDVYIFEDYELIRKYYEKMVKEDKEVVKTTNKKIRALEDLKDKLKYVNPNRLIKNNEDTNRLLFDDEIKYKYLLFALSHNYNLYKLEEEKNIEFNNNSLTKLEILFSKYGFNFNDFNEEEKESIITETSVYKVESILNAIKYSELTFISDYSNEFMKVIIFSKPEIIKFIDVLLKDKIIDKKFIFKNISILCDTKEFNSLYNNINYLSSIGINVSNVVKDDSKILLLSNEDIITKTNILGEYNLKLDQEEVYNFDILKDDRLLDLLDSFIELGLKDIVLSNPKYLTLDNFDTIKRIVISNLIGINPINKSNKIIGSVSTGNNFYVSRENYDNFIIDYKEDYQNPICLKVLEKNKRNVISASTKNRTIIKKLDELYMKDELTYVIDGVIISRNRVIRNLEVLLKDVNSANIDIKDLVYQAILYKMIENVESEVLEQIYNSIYSVEISNNKIYTLK